MGRIPVVHRVTIKAYCGIVIFSSLHTHGGSSKPSEPNWFAVEFRSPRDAEEKNILSFSPRLALNIFTGQVQDNPEDATR